MHKGQHLLIFIMFLSLFFIALLMGMAGPSIITTYEESAAKLVREANNVSVDGEKVESKIPAGPYLMVTPGLETYRQQVRMPRCGGKWKAKPRNTICVPRCGSPPNLLLKRGTPSHSPKGAR